MSLTPEELRKKIEDAQAKDAPASTGPGKSSASLANNKALRVATDFSAAVIVGAVLGFGVDRWLGTKPFGMIILLILGFAAGIMNVYKAQTRKTD